MMLTSETTGGQPNDAVSQQGPNLTNLMLMLLQLNNAGTLATEIGD